ncbi:MAG: hypothetical protein OIF48_08905, partial [Silicimonas sp.]|nr:hypothetical protein [Silicimonas sp.]
MSFNRILSTSSLLALLAGPALADLTAEEVLADQLAQLALYGFNVETTGQSKSGNVLTVDGLTASGAIPDEEMTIAMSMGGITLTEQGDGSVKVTYPASQDIKFEVSGSELDETVSVSMSLSQSDMEMVASGTLEQLRYEFSGDSVSVDNLVISGFEDSEQVEMNMDIDMTGVAGVLNIGS